MLCVMDERRDVVVIGGGIAGLAAAWRLRDRDVLLLEADDRLGGRLRSDPRGEYWMNYGAHLFPAPGSLVDSMARDCDLRTAPVTGGMMGLAVGSTLLDRGRVETLPAPAAVAGPRQGRVRRRRPQDPAGRRAPPPPVAGGGRRDARRRPGAHARLRGRSDVRGVPRPAAPGRRGDPRLRRPPGHGRALGALGRLRHRPLRAGVGRQGIADRPQPHRRHGRAARRARAQARAARPHRVPRHRAAARRRRAARRLRGGGRAPGVCARATSSSRPRRRSPRRWSRRWRTRPPRRCRRCATALS